jgi:hypothetical protein
VPLYLLSVCYPAGSVQPSTEALEAIIRDVEVVHEALIADRSWVFGGGLGDPSTSTTVLAQDGEVVLTDGPFIESKEQIGGFSVIEAADLDVALSWAGRMSRATTTPIEVRPFVHATKR